MSHRTAELSFDADDGWCVTFWEWTNVQGAGRYTSSSTWAMTPDLAEAARLMSVWLTMGERPESPR
jgi:hypothetical protein